MDGTAEKIRAKVSAGLLPRQAPVKTWGGFGSGRPCDGCAEPILPTEVEHEVDFEGSPTIRLHAACYAVWRQLVLPRRPGAAQTTDAARGR
jgi:hypothetical protein